MLKAVLIAGGSGTRLWPLSRAAFPKQFLSLNSKNSMLQSTINRLDGIDVSSLVTICNEEHRFFVAEQLREIDKLGSIILEPVAKNTAPALALAAMMDEDDSLLLVLAADHVIQDNASFVETINEAIPLAQSGKLVTFGIVPDEAHTGYGYIKKGAVLGTGFKVSKFTEKPSKEIASQYLSSDDYLWNSGMFLMKSSRYLEELEKYRPDIYEICKVATKSVNRDMDFLRINKEEFLKCPSDSIDYAVLEKTSDAVVVPMNAGWSDIGSWSTLWELSKKDKNGNVGNGDVLFHESKDCFVNSGDKLVATCGVENLVVVSTKDALLVSHKDSVQDTKIIAQKLKKESRSEWQFHREVFRPWGKYDSIDNGVRYQVKRITVNPGAKLSVQKHHHRAEHWIVVSGTAKVTKGEETFILTENQSTYIPVGTIHSLENPGKIILELIEVQSGGYLGEDDIVRFEDRYGR